MKDLPAEIKSVEQLDELLSRPSDALVEYFRQLDGDILILGAGGKIGPAMTRMAKRAVDAAGVKKEVMAADVAALDELGGEGIKTFQTDMLDPEAVKNLPKAENIVYMVGRKFGSSGSEWLTWAVNAMIPHNVARVFTGSRIAVFSTGCVYPLAHVFSGGSCEEDSPAPVGEYAMSCLGRERIFDYFSNEEGLNVLQIRLNYALELRYGVLFDIASKVFSSEPVDVTTGFFNGIWQGDCCDQVLRSLHLASSPASILNITGPETVSVRHAARRFGRLLGKEAVITGEENGMGYLSNASTANSILGNPSVPVGKIIDWTAAWVAAGGKSIGKPTHFETQNGNY